MSNHFTPLMLAAHPGPRKVLRRALRQRQHSALRAFLLALDRGDEDHILLEGLHAESHSYRIIRLASGPGRDSLITNIRLVKRYGGIWVSEPGPLDAYVFPAGSLALQPLLSPSVDPGLSEWPGVCNPNVHLLTLNNAGEERGLILIGHRFPWFSAEPRRPADEPDRSRYGAVLAVIQKWGEKVCSGELPHRVIPSHKVNAAAARGLFG